jgi:predicted kinase
VNTAASPTLHVIFGPSGAGKSTYGADLARRERAVAFSIDDWMARLFAQDMPQQPDFNWLMDRVERCEAQIWSTAAAVMASGTPVVLDLGLLRRADRARVAEIAHACDLPAQFHYLTAPKEVRRGRVLSRNQVQGEGFSFVLTPEMFDFSEGVFEPPEADELAGCHQVESA